MTRGTPAPGAQKKSVTEATDSSMGVTGLELPPVSLGNTHVPGDEGTELGPLTAEWRVTSPDLRRLADLWPVLDPVVRATILNLAEGAVRAAESTQLQDHDTT